MIVSLNLSTGEHNEVDASLYDSPLFVTENGVVVEVVFWSPPRSCWIVLVSQSTGRTWPKGAATFEVPADQIEEYAGV